MKKTLFLMLALVLVISLAVPAVAHADSDQYVTDLIAGQNMDGGDIEVWSDGSYLYVKYETTGGWVLKETHLAIADSLDGIAQTKSGNPIPGKFPYSNKYDVADEITEDTYQIPLADIGVTPCQESQLYIAAHAVVVNLAEPHTMCVVSNVGDTVYGPIYSDPFADSNPFNDWNSPLYAVEAKNWIGIADNPIIPDIAVGSYSYNWGNGQATDIPDALWISTARDTENWWQDSWRWFTESFDIPGYPMSGSVQVNADNEYWAYVNGHQVGWDNKIFDALKTHPFDPVMGSNMLDFIVKNWAQGSEGNLRDQIGNPNGLTYKATIEWADKETAWGTGVDFGGANWAMYFMYTVQPCVSGQVMNGGFEAPVVTTSQGWHIYDSGTEGLGWTVDWYDPEGKWIASAPSPAHLELHHGVNNWQSYKGGQHAELDTDWGGPSDPGSGEPASVRIYQDIKTCPCKTYTLTYAWSPRPGHADNQLEVHWGSTKLATHTASGTGNANTSWTLQTWTGLSGNPSGTTRLMFIEVGKPDSLGVFLDEVSVAEE